MLAHPACEAEAPSPCSPAMQPVSLAEVPLGAESLWNGVAKARPHSPSEGGEGGLLGSVLGSVLNTYDACPYRSLLHS